MPPSGAAGSTDHVLSAPHASSVSHPPSANISMPVQAIMAALSVQKAGGGNESCTWEYPLASRKARTLYFGGGEGELARWFREGLGLREGLLQKGRKVGR